MYGKYRSKTSDKKSSGVVIMIDHSQYGESILVRSYFKKNKPKHKMLVDIGAKNKNLSNTYDIIKENDWSGLLVEPHPDHFLQLKRDFASTSSTFVNKAVGDQNGMIDFFIHKISGHSSLYRKSEKVIKVEMIHIKTLLEENDIPFDFDFLSIDAEGGDALIVNNLLFTQYRPKILIYEKCNGVNMNLLLEYYKLLYETEGNYIYERV